MTYRAELSRYPDDPLRTFPTSDPYVWTPTAAEQLPAFAADLRHVLGNLTESA